MNPMMTQAPCSSLVFSSLFRISTLLLGVLAIVPLYTLAQTANEDYDVLVIPVGPSISAPGKDLSSSESLDARGLQILSVPNYELPDINNDIRLGTDTLSITLKPGQAIQIFSQFADGIPVSATSIYFSTIASVSGEQPQQAALALLDSTDLTQQAVSISYNQDVPYSSREFSMEYRRPPGGVYVLIQAVGPEKGESTFVLERMRLLDGYRELDISLGAIAVTEVENFGDGIDSVSINPIAGTQQGYITISEHNHLRYPSTLQQSLLIGTNNSDEVTQVMIPLAVIPGALEAGAYPRRFYGTASVRRISGEEGTFTVALASGSSTSVGYESHPLTTLPTGQWTPVQCPIQFTDTSATSLLLIVQIQGGPAEIAVDDVSIQARQDSIYLWDASFAPGNNEGN